MKQIKRVILSACVILWAPCFSGVAHAIPFQNGSFETGPSFSTGFLTLDSNPTGIDGWTLVSGSIDYIGAYWTASDGSRSVDMDGLSPGTISQTFDTTPNAWYEVLFEMAGNPDSPPVGSCYVDYEPKSLQVSAAGNSVQYSFDSTSGTRTEMGWIEQSFLFQAADAQTTLTFASLMSENSPYGVALDNVRVSSTAPVPEPATMLLFGTGLIGLAGLGKKKFFKNVQ